MPGALHSSKETSGERKAEKMSVAYPLWESDSRLKPGIKARDLEFEICPKKHAVDFIRRYHSRLPKCQSGPWMYAFRAHYNGKTIAAALWNNTSARTLPSCWLELRRLACSPEAPFNTCSRFLAWMARFLKQHAPTIRRLISYQDTAVHHGTIYKASGWHEG